MQAVYSTHSLHRVQTLAVISPTQDYVVTMERRQSFDLRLSPKLSDGYLDGRLSPHKTRG